MKKFSILFIAFLMLFSANIFAVAKQSGETGVPVNGNDKEKNIANVEKTLRNGNNVTRTNEATIIFTVPDIWADNTGYQMLLDPTASLFGTTIPDWGNVLSGDCTDSENIYEQFAYKIPENANNNCTTQNIIQNGSVSINIPAGTYDWCITITDPYDYTVWFVGDMGNIAARQNDYVFLAGCIYEFEIPFNNPTAAVNVTITEQFTEYNLYVADVRVTSDNRDNITAAIAAAGHTASGTITYNPESNVLTLNNATITVTTNNLRSIQSFIPDLTLELIGENNVIANYLSICFEASATITGTGSLTVTSTNEDALFHSNCNLTIENTTVTANGAKFGIRGMYGDSEILSITNSTVRATGTNTASIGNINSLVLNGCFISQPAGAEFNASQKAVCLNGTKVKTEVVIEPATTYTVSGTVLDNENNPLAGVTIAYNDGTTTTTADGTYSFTTIENTTHTITPSKFAYTFEPATATVNVVDADVTGIDFVGTEGEIYDLYVAGVQVTTANKNDITSAISGQTGVTASGTITYNPESNTLTLEDASISSSEVGINNFIANLRINLIGENEITSTDDGIVINESTTITGGGSLTATSSKAAIWHRKDTLTIENTIVTLNGGTYGISGGDNNEILTINNSIVKATGTNEGSIAKIKNLILNSCEITQPEGAIFAEEQKAVCLNGTKVKTEVVIEPAYDLRVAGVQVTLANKNNITGTGISGSVSYNPENKVLTLNNASINLTGLYVDGIDSRIDNLIINLIGANTISADNSYGQGIYSSQADFLITGTGSLTINASTTIYHYGCNLTIENTTVTAIGNNWGICGENYNEVLTITNSTVKATGTDQGSIVDIHNLILNGCAITQPVGAVFDENEKGVFYNGEIVKTEIVIEPVTHTVSGTVKDNENNPIADVTITYNGGTTTTLTDGTYSFTAYENTTYTVTPSLTGYAFTPATKTVNVAQADVTGIDFVGTVTYNVEGLVKDNEDNPIADVTITYNGGTTTTLTDGTYSFTAYENTTYTVTPSLVGYTFAPATATVNVVEADVTGIDFLGTANAVSPTTYTVSGTVKTLADDSPIEGVTITYNGGGINGTATTAADGSYSFTANANTTYTLVANKTGFSFAPATKTVNVAEADLTGVVFFGTAVATYTVSGTVRAFANDSPIAGVTISYTGGSTTTASDGIFSFTAEANTTYTVTPSKAGYKFTPATKIVNVAEADVTGVIFFGTADGTPVDETEINAITVYPNPANDYIKVAGLTGNEQILVFDINGRVVKTLEANNNIETISINDLAKGSYMIKVRKENKIEILKFIK